MVIKIDANPYTKNIRYYERKKGSWEEINSGKLIEDGFQKNAFVFKMKNILDAITHDYAGNIELHFVGCKDDYDDLKNYLKTSEANSRIKLSAFDENNSYLNAAEVLPKIKGIFKEMEGTFKEYKNEDIEAFWQKYQTTSEKTIPICVTGIVSAGKSTFVNALIGQEILPSGDSATTSKICHIKKSKANGKISFLYEDEQIVVVFADNSNPVFEKVDESLFEKLEAFLELKNFDFANATLEKQMSLVLSKLVTDNSDLLDSLINIEIPFKGGLLANSEYDFEIYDTPGDGSISQAHQNVLNKALEDQTNGLPVLITKSDTFDLNISEEFKKHIDVPALEKSFLMLVINRADIGIKDKDIKAIKEKVQPTSNQLFFVSSLMALGGKKEKYGKTELLDCADRETFATNKAKFQDDQNEFYKQLYKNNLLPYQRKVQSEAVVEKSDDLLFANSGLMSVENEIIYFAKRFAQYNKCYLSKRYLSKATEKIHEHIGRIKSELEKTDEELEKQLDEEKEKLMETVRSGSEDSWQYQLNNYEDAIGDEVAEPISQLFITPQEIQTLEPELENSTKKGFRETFAELRSSGLLGAFKTAVEAHGIKRIDKKLNLISQQDGFTKNIENAFGVNYEKVKSVISASSKNYWEESVRDIKNCLAKIANDNTEITLCQKEILNSCIAKFEPPMFSSVKDLESISTAIDNARLPFSKKVWKGREITIFNNGIKKLAKDYSKLTNEEHSSEFNEWRKNLTSAITSEIVAFNDNLRGVAEMRKNLEGEIHKKERLIDKVQKMQGKICELLSLQNNKEEN